MNAYWELACEDAKEILVIAVPGAPVARLELLALRAQANMIMALAVDRKNEERKDA